MKFSAEELFELAMEMYRKAGFDRDEVSEGLGEWAYWSADYEYDSIEEVKEELETLIENDLAAREEN